MNTGFFKREKRGSARFTARELGDVVIDGLGLLVHGYPGVKLWETQPSDKGFRDRVATETGKGFCATFCNSDRIDDDGNVRPE